METIIRISDHLYNKITMNRHNLTIDDITVLINAVVDSIDVLPKYHGPIVDLYDVQDYDEGKIVEVPTIAPSNTCKEAHELHRKE